MSLIKEALWQTEFSTPMPKGTTYWDFAYKRELKWIDQDIKDQMALVKQFEALPKPSKDLQDYILDQKEALGRLYKRKSKLETEGLKHE